MTEHRIRILLPIEKRDRIRSFLSGPAPTIQREHLAQVIAAIDAAELVDDEHLAITVTEDQRLAASEQLAAAPGTFEGKLSIFFAQPPTDDETPAWSI